MTRVEYRRPWRIVIAPCFRQAELFVRESQKRYPEENWHRYTVKVVLGERPERLHGLDLRTWEVWWLEGMWPCRTREEVENMERIKAYARMRGARLRRWWT